MDKIINKQWGKEYWLKVTDNYAFKKLEINSGKKISLQYHKIKEETWYIASGIGTARINDEIIVIKPGDTIHLKPNTIHQVFATTDLIILEASTTELDDIERIPEV